MRPIFDPYKKQPFKRLLVAMIIFFAVAVLWYIIMRILSPYFKVEIETQPIFTVNGVPKKPLQKKKSLNVGCFNIAHGRGDEVGAHNFEGGDIGTKFRRLLTIGDVLYQAGLDIVVLNEADFQSIWSKHVDQADIIARKGEFVYTAKQRNVDVSFPFCHFKFGNAVLSKFPIIKAEAIEFEPYSRLEKWAAGAHDALVCTIQAPGSFIRVIAVHLDTRDEQFRIECAQKVMNIVKSSDWPAILMGDFNSTLKGYPGHQSGPEGKSAVDILIQSGLFDPPPRLETAPAPDNFTFPSTEPDRMIDWILVSKKLNIDQYRILDVELSDHRPVAAKIVFADSDSPGPR